MFRSRFGSAAKARENLLWHRLQDLLVQIVRKIVYGHHDIYLAIHPNDLIGITVPSFIVADACVIISTVS
jgi:hypothetical protein